MEKLLIVDDETSICTSLSFALEDEYQIFVAEDESTALQLLTKQDIAIILLDLRLGSSDGIQLLKQIKTHKPDIVVIMMTAYGTIESSVEAMKAGAFYYIAKPINIDELHLLLLKAKEYMSLNSRIKYLTDQISLNQGRYNIIGTSKKITHVFDLIERIKDIDSNVLITGESGTGKELVARAIHTCGNRQNKPFHIINCSAIPGHLLESELFGFKKGSFTGAFEDQKGIIELSNGGTLFLDEIGDMDLNLQTKLLRVIQDKKIRPIGASKEIQVDVRFISATNKDLREEIKLNTFRMDLFYRLNVIHIHMPPLRERKEDIPKLTDFFIKKYNIAFSKEIKGITHKALDIIEKYKFDGNVRELQNIIERAVALTNHSFIHEEDLPEELFITENVFNPHDDLLPIPVGESMKHIEKKVITATLKKYEGNRKRTAEILGISERALRYKIKEYQLT
ncbi:sigma-54-dependent transcriptional regulator [Geosporobacter ferrireducens]|uniref:sigma-54-dependent transcriptional regulator n=1 Tax=Geosporobacter ferrireducens TaxID=1424294 RepID=UPI000B0844B1|nr:sigma-54 dependent transcriptional regulator [Geosporobacter ferrireducens]